MENALGSHLPHVNAGVWNRLSDDSQTRIYRFALERGYLDAVLRDYIVRPVLAFFRACDAMERRWTGWLSRIGQNPAAPARSAADVVEDLN
jgi:NAD(P)H-quinone oxidoreductase subunit 5